MAMLPHCWCLVFPSRKPGTPACPSGLSRPDTPLAVGNGPAVACISAIAADDIGTLMPRAERPRPARTYATPQLLRGPGGLLLAPGLVGRRARWRGCGVVCYLAGLPRGQVWTGSPVSAQWR